MSDIDASQPLGYWPVADGVFREKVGLTYDELVPGIRFEHRPGRTITEMDNVLMSALSMNTSPLHLDYEYASANLESGRPLVSSLVTLNIVASMSVRSTSGMAMANLGWSTITLPRPVHIGDTVYADSTVITRRKSQKNPSRGIVSVQTIGRVRGDTVISFDRSFMITCEPREPW